MTDPDTFCTMTVSEKIREGKRKRQVDVEYMPETRQLHIREVDGAPNPRSSRGRSEGQHPACYDPLGRPFNALGYQSQRIFVVANDDKIRVQVTSREGKRQRRSAKYGMEDQYDGSERRTVQTKGDFKLATADHEDSVQFEAKVNLGRVVGKIKSVQ